MRRWSCILMLGFIFLTLNGCQSVSMISQPVKKAESKLVKAVANASVNTKGMTRLKAFSYDLDLDKTEEKIELYTAAGRNKKGEIMWDDGQNWVLVVKDGAKAYPLLSQYVQLGSVYFTISNNGAGKASNLDIMIQTTSGFCIESYAYENAKGGFVGETVYSSKDTNFMYSSIPDYR